MKYNVDRVNRYNARLQAKGCTQTHDMDYEETFAPVAKMVIVCVVLTIAATSGWDLHHIDVKNAFLLVDMVFIMYVEVCEDL